MASAAAFVGIPAACRAVIDTSNALLGAINAIRQVQLNSDLLCRQLEECQLEVELIKLRLESTGMPTTDAGRQALQLLHETLETANAQASVLAQQLAPAPAGTACRYHRVSTYLDLM